MDVASALTTISNLATRQYGIITTAELHDVGIDDCTIHRLRTFGALQRIHHSTFAAGHRALSQHARWYAAVVAAGPGAGLSHEAAAALWGIGTRKARHIDVSAPRQIRPFDDVSTHRLPPGAIIVHPCGIPVTSTTRTILDLAPRCRSDELAHVLHQASFLDLLELDTVERELARTPRRRGSRCLREALELHRGGSAGRRSSFESRVRRYLDASGVAPDRFNVRIPVEHGVVEVDMIWDDIGICGEADGIQHRAEGARAADERRDDALARIGIRTFRIDVEEFEASPALATRPLIDAILEARRQLNRR